MNSLKEEILSAVRNRIASEEAMDDGKALAIISEEVFSRDELSGKDVKMLRELCREIFYMTRSRLGILKPLADDPSITEIMVNGAENIFVERRGKLERVPLAFSSVSDLEEIIIPLNLLPAILLNSLLIEIIFLPADLHQPFDSFPLFVILVNFAACLMIEFTAQLRSSLYINRQ